MEQDYKEIPYGRGDFDKSLFLGMLCMPIMIA